MSSSRGFEEVSVIACGVQTSKDRFFDDEKPPPVCHWRCNLTGLSKKHNLYFAAFVDEIYVYQPRFPNQWLSEHPDLVLALPVSRPGLAGCISTTQPHAVNNLIVEDLGNEEILACVCDDGDVIAYYTKHIADAVRRRSEPDNLETPRGDDVGAFFTENVRLSAWGLAVHKEARILAVSSNTHNVTVFKFALVDKDESHPQRSSLSESRERQPNLRINERRFELIGHTANIPCVAFCNTPEDPTGRWLMSVDINGVVYSWDLETETVTYEIVPNQGDIPVGHAWSLLCLDKRSFRQTASLEEAFGVRPEYNLVDFGPTASRRYQALFDISRSRTSVRETSLWSWHFDSGLPVNSASGEELMSHGDAVVSQSAGESSEDDDDPAVDPTDHDAHLGLLDPPIIFPAVPGFPSMRTTTCRPSRVLPKVTDSQVVPGPNALYPNFPFLHTTAHEVFLAAGFRTNETNTLIKDPLGQKLPPTLGYHLYHLRRMNMLAQIPEIGVVVIASQVGRVGIFSLTRPPNLDVHTPFLREGLPKPNLPKYAMRLDWVLPFRSQERKGNRPEAPLLGVAVGIVQGTETMVVGERRWRLMLTYTDHTILSYEIGGASRRGRPDVVV